MGINFYLKCLVEIRGSHLGLKSVLWNFFFLFCISYNRSLFGILYRAQILSIELYDLVNISTSVQHPVQFTGYPQHPGSPLRREEEQLLTYQVIRRRISYSVHAAGTAIYTQLARN